MDCKVERVALNALGFWCRGANAMGTMRSTFNRMNPWSGRRGAYQRPGENFAASDTLGLLWPKKSVA